MLLSFVFIYFSLFLVDFRSDGSVTCKSSRYNKDGWKKKLLVVKQVKEEEDNLGKLSILNLIEPLSYIK